MVVKVDKSQEFVDSGQKLISEYPPLKEKPVTIYSDGGQESERACQLVAALGGKHKEYKSVSYTHLTLPTIYSV